MSSVIPSFAERQRQWSSPPVDDIGYIPSKELLAMSDADLRALIGQMERTRYGGWRNYQGRWRDVLGLDTTHGKRVLDYGCGVGLEALQYAKAGNEVWVADIAYENLQVAQCVLDLYGFGYPYVVKQALWLSETPFPNVKTLYDGGVDVIHCCGVLHHIPDAQNTVRWMWENLEEDGELRLMVYSDQAWRTATGTEPPDDVTTSPHFERYWQHWDPHGGYADWYDRARLEQRFGEWFRVARCTPLTEHGEYLGAVLVKR